MSGLKAVDDDIKKLHDAANELLRTAIYYENLYGVTMAINAGADANTIMLDNGQTVLMRAAEQMNLPIVTALLDAGADANKTNQHNQTAYTIANASREPNRSQDVIDLLHSRMSGGGRRRKTRKAKKVRHNRRR